MTPMIVQVYEIQDPRHAEQCIALGVDHIGSVLLSQEQWRQPSLKDVFLLSGGTQVRHCLLPLFQDIDTLSRCLDYYRPHYLHLCNSLTDHLGRPVDLERIMEFQGVFKEKFPEIGIIRSIPIPGQGMARGFPTLKIAKTLEPASDLFLIDTWLERGPIEGFIGITGRPADWELSRELVCQSNIPVMLAGGLSPENVFEALLKVRPYGADTCTHTNRVDRDGNVIRFQKDYKRVEEFVKEARRADKAIKDKIQGLRRKLEALKRELGKREAALPAHSIKPHQIMAIEALEEEIALLEWELKPYEDEEVWP
jgi:phosphoribosylanthranilate isomerase